MKVLIKNSQSTSNLQPSPYDSWLEYWESKKGEINPNKSLPCPAGCGKIINRDDLDGCHVQKVLSFTGKMYIVPLCSGCNHRTDSFYVEENLLVPAP